MSDENRNRFSSCVHQVPEITIFMTKYYFISFVNYLLLGSLHSSTQNEIDQFNLMTQQKISNLDSHDFEKHHQNQQHVIGVIASVFVRGRNQRLNHRFDENINGLHDRMIASTTLLWNYRVVCTNENRF
jgi:hypothetical protein